MHNLLVTHAKYVENETTCLGTRTRQAMVMATLSRQSYSDDTEQNCHRIYERQGEKQREGEEVWESERKRDTRKHLVDCWYRKRQSRVGLNSGAGRHEGRGKERKRSGLLYKICIHCMHSVSIPLPTAALLTLFALQLSPALPFSLLCFQVAFVAAKFA